jgi:hypothetical protein
MCQRNGGVLVSILVIGDFSELKEIKVTRELLNNLRMINLDFKHSHTRESLSPNTIQACQCLNPAAVLLLPRENMIGFFISSL